MSLMTFGKYKGLPVEAVARKDPKYTKWALANVDGFELPEHLLELVEVRLDALNAAENAWSDEGQDCAFEDLANIIEDDQDRLDELFGMSDGKYGGSGA